jgi:hypothetical protein
LPDLGTEQRSTRFPDHLHPRCWRTAGGWSLRREATRRWVDWAAAKRREGEGATTTRAEWANDGGLYDEGVEDVSVIEQFLAEDLGVPGVEAGKS